jgi:hypothetical protein
MLGSSALTEPVPVPIVRIKVRQITFKIARI